ncbi:complex I assembly factor TIMMDC1, mitochondrial [Xiphias gladius]|uniref:complex I assembly factor TIMMDC1, mitochondrial n=1 Tax=Xiphias gladius TaxID=8245 RepID=UPI001A998DD4|nr:complex I assembly factor TIMMDC1, mitochondrial [Xiphias gladius]XP_039997783.1 complex I assembly factor TIMMDC1, mitochondrial [Xiphias gladius]XP_039997784.1 complex I assembly factor TIMMDC1, mitochondrial [Xiphias gladius]XP_039997785.1 complex I assembly factor TIMMDC1, mitochondrial [Xiphias gladius]XP_039997786.1 complex I assembly factor TIMMDC1, mitochondrial [Xiphias gladius]XP_039997787.1 complex I assembly factor TIMMDC1, mitochondrial [Xiphias gladius]
MYPEQPRTGLARQRRQADSIPWGTLSTGLLQGLVQSARPPSFCFLLPRVHAADVAAAQPAQMPSSPSSSTGPAPAPISPPSTMPSNMSKPEFPDTGWDRIKDLFERDATHRYPEELTNVIKSGVVAALVGLIYGGLPAARHARQRYIQVSQAEIYSSRVEAVRSAHNAAIRGFVRYGWRWSWRVAAFVTLFNSVSTGLSVYRDKYSLSHYATAGAVTGGLFRLNLGLGGLVAGTIIGAVLGIPTGALILSMQSLAGETVRERRRRERRELYELRLADWMARLQLTDELIGDLNVSCQAEETNKDMKRIQELLSLPQNEDAAQDSSS